MDPKPYLEIAIVEAFRRVEQNTTLCVYEVCREIGAHYTMSRSVRVSCEQLIKSGKLIRVYERNMKANKRGKKYRYKTVQRYKLANETLSRFRDTK